MILNLLNENLWTGFKKSIQTGHVNLLEIPSQCLWRASLLNIWRKYCASLLNIWRKSHFSSSLVGAPSFVLFVCLLLVCVMMFHFNSGPRALPERLSATCGCRVVERMWRMLTIFRLASFLTDKIQKLKNSLKELMGREHCKCDHTSWAMWILYMSLCFGNTN